MNSMGMYGDNKQAAAANFILLPSTS